MSESDPTATDATDDNQPVPDAPAAFPAGLVHYYESLRSHGAAADGRPDDPAAIGATTTQVADDDTAESNNRSNVSRTLGELADDDAIPIRSERVGNPRYYWIDTAHAAFGGGSDTADDGGSTGANTSSRTAESGGDTAESGDGRLERLPNPNPDELVPSDVPEYQPSGAELRRIRATVSDRQMGGRGAPSCQLVGPTAVGKTHAVEYVASERDAAVYRLDVDDGITSADIIGRQVPVAGGYRWDDGTVTAAFRASQEADRPVYLLIDELNRAPPEQLSSLMSVLDDRAEVVLPGRGGERVKADTSNIAVFATLNPSDNREYGATFDLDFAQDRRFDTTAVVDKYVGENHFDREVDIIKSRVPEVSRSWAEVAVDFANALREAADTDPDGAAGSAGGFGGGAGAEDPKATINRPLPTGKLIDFAERAVTNESQDFPDPGRMAAEGTVLNQVYRQSDGREWIAQRIVERFGSVSPTEYEAPDDGSHTPHRNGEVF